MSLILARAAPARARRELVVTWLVCIATLAAARALASVEPTGLLAANLAGVAAFLFIVLPERLIRARGERWSAFGFPWSGLRSPVTWRTWLQGVAQGLLVCAIVFPLFLIAFRLYAELLPRLPVGVSEHLAPYLAPTRPELRFPPRFPLFLAVQVLAVALPEELFYRGWMQTTWAATAPSRRRTVLGASIGAGFLQTQLLFALGHLVVLQAWRLGTFFPSLLFGWLRERTGSLVAPIVVHALSNAFIAVLEASFYG